MSYPLYAHTGRLLTKQSSWQTLAAHLDGVAQKAAGGIPPEIVLPQEKTMKAESVLWNDFGLYLYIAGLLHDLGKADTDFQEYLNKSVQAIVSKESVRYRCRILVKMQTANAFLR